MYKEDLALNNLQWLICHKTQPNQNRHSASFFFQYKLSFVKWFEGMHVFESFIFQSVMTMHMLLCTSELQSDSLVSTTTGNKPEQEWHLLGAHRVNLSEMEGRNKHYCQKKQTLSWRKKASSICLCWIQDMKKKSFNIVCNKVTSLLVFSIVRYRHNLGIGLVLECSPMVPETWIQSQVASYQRL